MTVQAARRRMRGALVVVALSGGAALFAGVSTADGAGLRLAQAETGDFTPQRPLKKKMKTGAKPAAAPQPAEAPKAAAASGGPMLPGAGSKEPINIDAAKLDYFDKEQKMIYSGDVVAVQGESTLKASVLTIFLQKKDAGQPGAPAAAPGGGAGAPTSGSDVKKMEAEGPVTLISKDQIGTGDRAVYDKVENKVYLYGNVTLTQGGNVTQGDHLVYDTTTGLAQVYSGDSNNGRVTSVFVPGSGAPDPAAEAGKKDKDKPASTKRKTVSAPKSASTTARDPDVQD